MASSNDIQRELLSVVGSPIGDSAVTKSPLTVVLAGQSAPGNGQSTGAAATDTSTLLARELESLRRQLGSAEETSERQTDILEQNTRAVLESANRSGGGALREAASVVQRTGGASVLASPLTSLVSWLFRRGGESPAEPALDTVARPSSIDGSLGITSGNIAAPVTYGADGLPRTTPPLKAATATNITVNVQTMDSRSFADNSDQIARAVREAMLNSHSLNDVIGDM